MRIEAIDSIRATDDDGSVIHMEAGDIKTVGGNFGALACKMGWAKDVDGAVETGEKTTRKVVLTPANVIVETSSQ